jgi:Mannosyltransferase (PIG-V)
VGPPVAGGPAGAYLKSIARECDFLPFVDTVLDGDLQTDPRRPGLSLSRRSLDAAQVRALRDTWRALWISRLLIWVAGVGAVLAFGLARVHDVFDPPHVTSGFGWLGDLLAAPAARWDAAWYLVIAHYGYSPELGIDTASRSAFFPLYPLGVRALSDLGLPAVIAGVLLSVVAFGLALYGIHRLTTLELGRFGGEAPRLAVLALALAPMAYYFSAVYSESLYLALSVGVFWCARRGRWAWVGVLGALAGATRSAGLVLVLPAAILYLYGPREDRAPDRPEDVGWRRPRAWMGKLNFSGSARAYARAHARTRALPGNGHTHSPAGRRGRLAVLRPRYAVRRDVLWLAAMPAGVVAYMTYLALAGGSATMPFHAQEVWNREFAGPYVAVWDGARAAFDGARQLLSFQRRHVYFGLAGGDPFVDAGHNLMLFAFLVLAVPAIVGVLRRLPLAYGVYVLAALALPLSYPVAAQPLMSLPRFEVVLFPLFMWLGGWLAQRPRARPLLLGAASLLLVCFVAQFATWHWVA